MTTPKLKTWQHGKQIIIGSTPCHPALKGTGDHPMVMTAAHPGKAKEIADAITYAFDLIERLAAADDAQDQSKALADSIAGAQAALAKFYRVLP